MNEQGRKLLERALAEEETERSRASILLFIEQAFARDFAFRFGLAELMQVRKEMQTQLASRTPTSAETNALQAKLKRALLNAPGRKIERAVVYTDSLGTNGIMQYGLNLMGDADERDLISHRTSALGGSRTYVVNALLSVGLIDDGTRQKLLDDIKRQTLRRESDVLQTARREVDYLDTFADRKAEERRFLRQLVALGSLSEAGAQKFAATMDTLLDLAEVMRRCSRVLTYELSDFPAKAEEAYQKLFVDFRQLIPDLGYEDLLTNTYVAAEESPGGKLIKEGVKISFRAKGIDYRLDHGSDLRTTARNEENEIRFKPGREITQSLNRYLRDQASDYRLHYVAMYDQSSWNAEESLLFALLTVEEARLWDVTAATDLLEYETYANRLSTDDLPAAVEQFAAIGLFRGYTETQRALTEGCAYASQVANVAELLHCLPDQTIYLGWETGNFVNPYAELTQQLASISRGQFTPSAVRDNFAHNLDAATTQYGFQYRGRSYTRELRVERDWLDPGFLDLINESLVDDSAKFYGIGHGVIFLTTDQFTYLRANFPEIFEYSD
ncbi:hypothetical protein [Neolewinella antarctica]|uniref:Uncharacterized protein n=1 Tax=Neolewinella antarctica TaxID=442734 RepID=A0ABX0XDP5_9BACT|nr:hypothetical protein [Neolewinella antarctica]NJC27051.1 hypothetical protein [Neolewinella antarctica]